MSFHEVEITFLLTSFCFLFQYFQFLLAVWHNVIIIFYFLLSQLYLPRVEVEEPFSSVLNDFSWFGDYPAFV